MQDTHGHADAIGRITAPEMERGTLSRIHRNALAKLSPGGHERIRKYRFAAHFFSLNSNQNGVHYSAHIAHTKGRDTLLPRSEIVSEILTTAR